MDIRLAAGALDAVALQRYAKLPFLVGNCDGGDAYAGAEGVEGAEGDGYAGAEGVEGAEGDGCAGAEGVEGAEGGAGEGQGDEKA